MTWSDFYLICFAIGFLLSFVSFIAGGLRWNLHIPHSLHFGGGHLPVGHAPVGHAPVGHATGGAAGQASGAPGAQGLHAVQVSPFNFITLTAFLAWFGGTGYLITRFSGIWLLLGLLIAVAAGLAGAAIVFLFLTRVLMSHEETMDPADYEMVGVLGKLSIPVREGGTGEIIYSQAGTRRTCGARSENGNALEKGAEVVVTRYEKGLAYVRRWEEMSGE
jgi:membrane protein implicated in regulation of membrane protease activity